MNRMALHELLVNTFGLIPEPVVNNVSRTYFYREVDWHPTRSTRVFRVLFDTEGEPSRIQLCASSDNNNAVLLVAPFCKDALGQLAAQEIAQIQARRHEPAFGLVIR
jgi:hypothetical protein